MSARKWRPQAGFYPNACARRGTRLPFAARYERRSCLAAFPARRQLQSFKISHVEAMINTPPNITHLVGMLSSPVVADFR
jgi:hypothetical protein